MVKRKRNALAQGEDTTTGKKKLAVHFDADQFDKIKTLAEDHGVSFGSMVRTLIEQGLKVKGAANATRS
jgi:cold shock CspA family protein